MATPDVMDLPLVERQEMEVAALMSAMADMLPPTTASTTTHAKRQLDQLGFKITLGGAVFSVGLNNFGLPAFTVTEVPPPPNATNVPVPPPQSPRTPSPTSNSGPSLIAGPALTPQAPPPTVPASTRPAPSTAGVLPTSPLISIAPKSSAPPVTSRANAGAPSVTTMIIFAGGSATTSVMTLTPQATGQSSGLSPPQIAGAVVGAIGGTAILVLLVVLFVRWRRHEKAKRMSTGESIKALHTSAAPMMAHNSARYTNLFPGGGPGSFRFSRRPGTVMSDSQSTYMSFLPAGAAGFLNRASGGSPLRNSEFPDTPRSTNAVPTRAAASPPPPTPTIPAQFQNLAPPSPVAAANHNSTDVAFLGAGASTWLNQNPSNSQMAQNNASTAPGTTAAAVAPYPHNPLNTSTRSLPSQTAAVPDGGQLGFMPGAASMYLNQHPASPMAATGAPYPHSPMPATAFAAVPYHSNASTQSLPAQVTPVNGGFGFIPPNATMYLNQPQNMSVSQGMPMSPIGAPYPMTPMPAYMQPMARSTSPFNPAAIPLPMSPAPESGQPSFIPGAAAMYLNQQPTQPNNPTSGTGTPPMIPLHSKPTTPTQANYPTNVAFLPGNASSFLNQNPSNPLPQPGMQAFPSAPSSSGGSSSMPYSGPGGETGRVTFLSPDASGFLNRAQFGPGVPQAATPPPVPASYHSPAAAASAPTMLAIPPAAHMTARDSAGTASNHKLNDNPEWFGSDAHDSRQLPGAAAASAPGKSPSSLGSPMTNRYTGHNEIDQFISNYTSSPPVTDSYGPAASKNPFDDAARASNAFEKPPSLRPPRVSRPGTPKLGSGETTPPPTSIPDTNKVSWVSSINPQQAPWSPPSTNPARANSPWRPAKPSGKYDWADEDGEEDSDGQQRVRSWPKPPDVDLDRPGRVRPKSRVMWSG